MDWKRLINALSEEAAAYAELLEFATEKREAVFEKDVQRLDAVVRLEQVAVTNLNHWEKQRLACMDAAGYGKSAQGQDPTDAPALLFFADIAPAAEGERLRSLHEELSGLLRKLSVRNAENKSLIESRLEYVQFALDALNAEQTAGLYGSGYGKVPQEGVLDRKTIMDLKG